MFDLVKPYLKAVVAAATPAILVAVDAALVDVSDWVLGVVTTVLTSISVWATPNIRR